MSNDQLEILKKIDKLDNRLDKIDQTLIKQHASIEHHIYRTNLLEKHVSLIEESVEPIKVKMNQWDGILKFAGVLGVLLGVAVAIKELFF